MCGNRLRQWDWKTYQNLIQTDYAQEVPAKVSVRNCTRGGDARVQRYRLNPWIAHLHCEELIKCGIVTPEQLILDESAPDHRVTLQCEVMNSERFIWMRYTLHGQGMGMRQAYEIMQPASGIAAVRILRHYLDGPSQDNLFSLLEEYPDDVVELSTYNCSVGVLGWNSLFWEVRGPTVDIPTWRRMRGV